MSNDVLITPASRKIEFKDSSANVDAKIETDASGNLLITNTGGDISIGDTTSDIFVGDGTNNIDIVFEQDGEIRGTSGVTVTLGASDSSIRMATDLNLNSNDITNVGDLTVTGNLTITGDINSYNVTDLDVSDKTITLGVGQSEVNSGNSGIVIAGSNASILWDESNDRWSFNKGISTSGPISSSATSGSSFYAASFTRSSSGLTTPDIWGSSSTLVLGTDASDERLALSTAGALIYGRAAIRQGSSDQNTSQDSASIPDTTGAEIMRFEGGYTNGQYTTEIAKVDRSGNLPLYIRQSKGTANSFSNIARFGDHGQTNGSDVFAVFGGARVGGRVTADNLTLNSISTQSSEATAVMIDGSGIIGTRELGSNAFNSTSYLTGNQTISLTGDVQGSGTTSINVSVNDDSHNHIISNVDGLQTALDGKLPLAGGTVTGGITSTAAGNAITISSASPQIRLNDTTSGADDFWIHVNSNIFYVLADRDDSGSWETPHPLLLNASNNIGYTFGQRIFTEAYHPNADTWTTARTITLGGDLTGDVSINGSANVTLTATVADDSHNHVISNVDGLQTALDAKLTSSSALNASNITSGTLPSARLGSDVWKNRGTINVTTTTDGSNSNPFDNSHSETKVAGFGSYLLSYTGASAHMISSAVGGSASVFQIGAHYNGDDFYMRVRTDSSNWKNWRKLWHDNYHPNADTLTTARTINGVSFNGSANITIADSTKLPLAGGELTGSLTIDVDNQAGGALRIEADQTNPDNDFYFAQEIYSTLSGTTATTADREQGGIYMDINSTATGGDTSNEHRAYGLHIDLDSTGDADLVYGVYSNATATPTTGTTTNVYGGYFHAEDNGGAGNVSTIIGVQGTTVSDNSTSDVNAMYAGYFKSYNVVDSAAIAASTAVYGEIEVATGSADIYGTSYVFQAQYDNNSTVAQTNTTYLYYGNYAGTLPTTAYGVYIADGVANHFAGRIEAGDGSTSAASYGFIGDINTGMYSPANHQLGFLIAGGQRLKLDSTGATVTGNLAVTGTVDGVDISAALPVTGVSTNADLRIVFSNAGALQTDANGNLSYNPSTNLLNVDGDINVGSSSDASRFISIDKATTGENGIIFKNGGGNKCKIVQDSSEFLQFHTNNAQAMEINEAGDVNITKDNAVLKFGIPGNGANVNGCWASLEGNTDGSGEGSGRLFFREHNSSTGSMDAYGMSLGYRGGADTVTTAGGNSWTGLANIGNGEWGMWGHDGNATGALIMHGPRSGEYVDFGGDLYIPDQIRHTGDTNTYMQFHAADQWRVVTGGSERLESNNTRTTVSNGFLQVTGSTSHLVATTTATAATTKLGLTATHKSAVVLDTSSTGTTGTRRIYAIENNAGANLRIGNPDYPNAFNVSSTGNISSTGDVIAYSSSDRRFKDNITPISNPIEKINKLSGNTFEWNGNQETYEKGMKDVGVIAQEVEEVLPEIVDTREDGYKAVKYEKMVALLIEGIKEQQETINKLTSRINNLEKGE